MIPNLFSHHTTSETCCFPLLPLPSHWSHPLHTGQVTDSWWPLSYQSSIASWITMVHNGSSGLVVCDPVLTNGTQGEVGSRLLGKIFLLERRAKRNGNSCICVWRAASKKIHMWKMMKQKNGKSLGPTAIAESLPYQSASALPFNISLCELVSARVV